jgi:hypothetical protein
LSPVSFSAAVVRCEGDSNLNNERKLNHEITYRGGQRCGRFDNE